MKEFFYPFTGCSVLLPVTTISTNVCLSSIGTTDNRGYTAVQIYNQSTNDVYINLPASSATTQSSFSTGPYPSTFTCGVAVPLHQAAIFAIPPVCWVSGLTTAVGLTANVLLVPGKLL